MGSIYKRRNSFWVKFRDPLQGQEIRQSLETQEEGVARCKLRKIELLCELRRPEVVVTTLPDKLQLLLLELMPKHLLPEKESLVLPAAPPSPAPPAEIPPITIEKALSEYLAFISSENAQRTVDNKLSILRKFMGSSLMERLTGIAMHKGSPRHKAEFSGKYVTDITPAIVQKFIEKSATAKKTRRHYRELFHHLFEFLLKRHMIEPRSWHTPNTMASLPSYWEKNVVITYMSSEEIVNQLEALQSKPVIRMAVLLMIETGLRRSEALWLTKDSVSSKLDYLSVVNRTDDEDIESSLKTGARSVTILPALRDELEKYLPTVEGPWLFPSPRGKRWHKDNFSADLRALNGAQELHWSALIYRHTYATRRALLDGWGGVRIAREMGNSIQMINKYYAGFIRPDAL